MWLLFFFLVFWKQPRFLQFFEFKFAWDVGVTEASTAKNLKNCTTMTLKLFLAQFFILKCVVFLPCVASSPPPSVIFNVIIDDLGWANVGWHSPNPPENLTPRLRELASSGIVLERQYNHFTCTPSRSAFTTGRLPVHVQLTLDNPDSISSGTAYKLYIHNGHPLSAACLLFLCVPFSYTYNITGDTTHPRTRAYAFLQAYPSI